MLMAPSAPGRGAFGTRATAASARSRGARDVPHDVAAGDDPDDLVVAVDDGNVRDLALVHRGREIFERVVGRDGERVVVHHLADRRARDLLELLVELLRLTRD